MIFEELLPGFAATGEVDLKRRGTKCAEKKGNHGNEETEEATNWINSHEFRNVESCGSGPAEDNGLEMM